MTKAALLLALLGLGTLAAPPEVRAQGETVKHERDLITQAEITERALDAKNAYDIVRRLRPHFLRQRSVGAIEKPLNNDGSRNTAAMKTDIQVYVNGIRRGGTGSLRELSRDAVVDIFYLGPSDATTRFGTGHESGAILVRTGVQ